MSPRAPGMSCLREVDRVMREWVGVGPVGCEIMVHFWPEAEQPNSHPSKGTRHTRPHAQTLKP